VGGMFTETAYAGVGFGLGFSVMQSPARAQISGTPGEFAWGGAAGTAFWVDPVEQMIVVFTGLFIVLFVIVSKFPAGVSVGELDLVVTRDDMRALKPDPDGWRVISEHFGRLANGAGDAREAVVVGDSWVDGVAAAKAGVSFIAYRARQEDLDRWQVTPIVHLADLALLPAWLTLRRNGRR